MRVRLGLITALSLPLLFACPVRSQTIDPSVAQADAAYTAKRFAEAIPLYLKVVSSDLPESDRARAQARIAYARYRLNDRATARTEWIAVADRFPLQHLQACDALVRAGNVAVSTNDYVAAIDILERAVRDHAAAPEARPFAPEALVTLGRAYLHEAERLKLETVKSASATEAWEHGRARYDQSTKAFLRVISEFADSGDWATDAEKELVAMKYEFALHNRGVTFDETIAAADTFLDRHPTDPIRIPTVRIVRAEALYQQAKYDAAIAEIGIIQKQYAATAGLALGSSQFRLGQCYEAKGDCVRAIIEYRKFLADAKPSFSAWEEVPAAKYFIGRCLKATGDRAGAIVAFGSVGADATAGIFSVLARRDAERLRASLSKAPPGSETLNGGPSGGAK